jgi:hypothetical protein
MFGAPTAVVTNLPSIIINALSELANAGQVLANPANPSDALNIFRAELALVESVC